MIFKFWRPYPLMKPKKDGWYQCTAAHGNGLNKSKVMDMFYRKRDDRWIDIRRQTVFDGYKVYKSCRAPIDDNRVYTDSDCERIDIIAWKPLPRCFRWRRK